MPKRFMSLLLALIYLSVALGISSAHVHHHPGVEQCPACAWLAHSITDVPVSIAIVRPSSAPIFLPAISDSIANSEASALRSDRGPPLLS